MSEQSRACPDRGRVLWWVVGVALFAASSYWVIDRYLIHYPDEIWQVDLEVYWEGSRSLVDGRQVYAWLTDNPQYLPFTYPPFGALLGTPLLLAPFRVVGWLWTFMQLGLLWICTALAFRPCLDRFDRRRGLAHGAVAAVLIQLQPVQDGIRFGQVNAILVTLCLLDVVRRHDGWWPRGSLTGIAAAIKLTPAVFWVHYALTRRWRALGVSILVAAAATALTGLFAPSATAAYWTDALLDPGRLGPNANTSNQSMRGVLMRIGPPAGPLQSLLWLALAVVVAVLGFRLAARLDRLGEPVAVVGVLGMLAVLLSPVSWIHHLHWGLVVIGALLGDGRDRRRVRAALIATVVLLLKLPWWGGGWQRNPGFLHYLGNVVEQSYCWFALGSLFALWWLLVRHRGEPEDDGRGGAEALSEVGAPAGDSPSQREQDLSARR
jgi:alpha-1,2-mannosyltransferase